MIAGARLVAVRQTSRVVQHTTRIPAHKRWNTTHGDGDRRKRWTNFPNLLSLAKRNICCSTA